MAPTETATPLALLWMEPPFSAQALRVFGKRRKRSIPIRSYIDFKTQS